MNIGPKTELMTVPVHDSWDFPSSSAVGPGEHPSGPYGSPPRLLEYSGNVHTGGYVHLPAILLLLLMLLLTVDRYGQSSRPIYT